MPKVQFDAHELSGTDVSRVSLVKRGANRVPFRIMKGEGETMLDLNKLGSIFRKKDPMGGVAAVLVAKSADQDKAKALIKSIGFSVDAPEESETVFMYRQPDVDLFDEAVLKMSDDIALVVSGFQKSFTPYNYESTTFGEVMATEGFYPSMHMATELLRSTVGNILEKADNASEATDAITKAVDDFKGFLASMAKSIPQTAFKAEAALVKADLAKAPSGTGMSGKPDEDEINKGKAKKEEISQSPTHGNQAIETGLKAPANNIEGAPAAGNDEIDQGIGGTSNNIETSPAHGNQEIAGVMKQLQDLVSAVNDNFKTLKGDLDANAETLTKRLDAVEGRIAKTETAVKGTVAAEALPDRATVHQLKSDRRVPPLMDTAFHKEEDDDLPPTTRAFG